MTLELATVSMAADYARRLRGQTPAVRIGFTNGCFDLLHAGHIRMLEFCKSMCGILFVGVNSDDSVARIKGRHRPFFNQGERVEIVSAIRYVNFCFVFEQPTAADSILCIKPDIWFKGAGWSRETLNKDEVEAAESVGCTIKIVKTYGDFSTSSSAERIFRRFLDAKRDRVVDSQR